MQMAVFGFIVKCRKCGSRIDVQNTTEEAAKAWNTRQVFEEQNKGTSRWLGLEKRTVKALHKYQRHFKLSDQQLFDFVSSLTEQFDFYTSALSSARKDLEFFRSEFEKSQKENKRLREALERIKDRAKNANLSLKKIKR